MGNGPIREVRLGCESTYNTEATTYHAMYFDGSPNRQDMFARRLRRVQNGTYTGSTLKALGGRHSTMNLKIPLLYDQAGYWLTQLVGYPVTSGLSGTAYRHTWTLPMASTVSAPPSASFLVYNNVQWVRMTGGTGNTGQFTFSSTEEPVLDITFLCSNTTEDVTPTTPAGQLAVVSSYDMMGPRFLEVDANAVNVNLIKGQFNVDNKRVPFWTARRSAFMLRAKRNGLIDYKFDATFDWTAYSGSIKSSFDGQTDLGLLESEWLDPAIIGTTAYHPRFMISAKNLIIETAEEPDDQGESANRATGQGAYDNATSAVVVFQIDNNIASYGPGV